MQLVFRAAHFEPREVRQSDLIDSFRVLAGQREEI
jgi:hypothetical protein